MDSNQQVPPSTPYGAPYGSQQPNMPYGAPPPDASKKVAAGVCGILLGALGVHKFILGYTTEGLVMLLVTILTCGIGGVLMGLFGLIEGILYLTKTDEDFYRTYIASKRGWF